MNRIAAALAASIFATTLATASSLLHAQAPAAPAPTTATIAPATMAPPVLPLITSYRYWPIQFVQFVGAELPYSMIELDVDAAGKKPLLYVTLVDRATGKRVHYAADDALIASAAPGDEIHKVAIAFEPADTENVGSISTLRFTMPDGKPLQWRFVQGSDISEQGSGLTAFPESKIPIFAYRESGGLAGEGTALQIGDTVSTASVWEEYSHPPYFVGYHGAETEGAHTLVILPGHQSWTVTSAPASLTPGASWELDEASGNHRSIHIDSADGSRLVVTSTDRFQPGVRCTLDVTRDGDGWSIDRARFAPVRDGEKHALTLQFATPLSAKSDHVDVTLLAGKKKSIATGAIASGATSTHPLTLTFSSPAWLSGKSITEESVAANGTLALSAHPLSAHP